MKAAEIKIFRFMQSTSWWFDLSSKYLVSGPPLKHHQPSPDGLGDRLGSAGCAEFRKDGCDVRLDRVLGDVEPVRDQLVAEPLSQKIQHFQLAAAERFGKFLRECLRFGQKLSEDRWRGHHQSRVYRMTALSISCGVASDEIAPRMPARNAGVTSAEFGASINRSIGIGNSARARQSCSFGSSTSMSNTSPESSRGENL